MSNDGKILEKMTVRALSGKGAHSEANNVFEELDWKLAGAQPGDSPHSVFQLLKHMAYWQDWAVRWLNGKNPPIPRHASGSWPDSLAPASSQEWKQAVRNSHSGRKKLESHSRRADLFAKQGRKSRLEMLHTIASHNSYHLGQVVLLRQMLGSWPPPSGGLTW